MSLIRSAVMLFAMLLILCITAAVLCFARVAIEVALLVALALGGAIRLGARLTQWVVSPLG